MTSATTGPADTTLLQGLRLLSGHFSPAARLYYFEGNFYYPFLSLHGSEVGRVRRAIAQFEKENRARVEQDRARPEYRTIVELFDEQQEALCKLQQ